MARLPRYVIPGQPQHIIQRGNNRCAIFKKDADYLYFLQKLGAAAAKHECEIHAYVLMINHIHLLVTPLHENSISKMQQMIGCHYVRYFNDSYRRSGTLWDGRYKATVLDSANYLLTCMNYIEMNPVRAGLVKHPSDYPWSSYGKNALGTVDPVVVSHREYLNLGATWEIRQKAYRQLFEQKIPNHILRDIRFSTNSCWVLGSDTFKSHIEHLIQRRTEPKQKGGDRKSIRYKKSKKTELK